MPPAQSQGFETTAVSSWTHHVGCLCESHGYPSLGSSLHVNVQVVVVALVSVDAYEHVAGTGIAALRVAERQVIVQCGPCLNVECSYIIMAS